MDTEFKMNRVLKMTIKSVVTTTISALALLSVSAQAKDIPGATPTSYGVGSSGAFQFSMPILVPEGRNGVTPNLALNFSSGRGAGAVGVGWSVSGLSAITRCGQSLAVDGQRKGVQHNANDRYCLNGQRLILVNGTQGADGAEYRTRMDSFSKIVAHGNRSQNVNGGRAPARWRVWTKGGQIIDYGSYPNVANHSAQFKLPGTNSIHTWNVARVSDREGNYYEASYRASDGLIDRIDYTHTGSTAKHTVDFLYEANTVDPRFRFVLGSRIDYQDRLKKVEVLNNNSVFRSYTLEYETAPMSGRSRVVGVKECGLNEASCMPSVIFDWQASAPGYIAGGNSGTEHNIAPDDLIEYYHYQRHLGDGTRENAIKEINRGAWADVNGDGEVDMVIAYVQPDGRPISKTYLRQDKKWVESNAWRLPLALRSYSDAIVNTGQARFLPGVINQGQLRDVNGDGLVDVVYSYRLDTDRRQYGTGDSVIEVRRTFINTGSGWHEDASWQPKDILFDYLVNGGGGHTRTATTKGSLVDVNGDGLVDWVTAFFNYTSNGNGIEVKTTWLNTGNGWARNAAYDMPDVFSQYRGIYSIPRGQFVDVNGDGLIDWMTSYQASLQSPIRKLWLNTGAGWQPQPANSPYLLPETMFDNINGWNNISPVSHGRFIDVNGDGLADWVASHKRPASGNANTRYVRLNTGKGWAARNTGFAAPEFVHVNFQYSYFDRGWPTNQGGEYMDINQDGLVDYVESFKSSDTARTVYKTAYLNNGTAWVKQPANSPYTPTQLYYDYSGREHSKANYGQFVDINADGASDWVGTRKGTTRRTLLMKTARADQLKSVTTTMGVTVEPTFTPLTDNDVLYTQYPSGYQPATPAGDQQRFVRGPIYVTSEVRTPTPDANRDRITYYQYEGLRVSRIHGSLGFRSVSTANSLTSVTSYRENHQQFPLIGMTKRNSVSEGDRLVSVTETQYQRKTPPQGQNPNLYFVHLKESTSQQYEPNAVQGSDLYRTTRVSDVSYDDYGNLLGQTTSVYDGNADFSGSTPPTALHTTQLTNVFEPANINHWLIGQVASVTQTTTTTGKAPVTNETEYTYAPDMRNNINLGRLDKVIREPNGDATVKATSKYTYDNFGNVVSETTYQGDETTLPGDDARKDIIEYDALYHHRLPTKLINALGHDDKIAYHAQCDLPKTVTDTNGLISSVTYDEFCRVKGQTSPINLTTTVEYDTNPSCAACDIYPVFSVKTTTPGEPAVTQYYNEFNQVIGAETTGMLDQAIVQLTRYDSLGRTKASSQPFFIGEQPHFTKYQYDDLGRVTQTTLPYDNDATGTSANYQYAYGVDSTTRLIERTTTNTLGRETKARVNALGQVHQVIDALGSALTYTYDSQGNLSQTRDVLGNEIKLKYDVLGRRTELDDPDLGISTYQFNIWGELVSQTDAKKNTISMVYDKLSRLTQRTVPGGAALSGGISTWVYDVAPWAANEGGIVDGLKGAIASVSGPNGYAQSFKFDEFGRPISEETTIRDVVMKESYKYDNFGYLSERYYPSSTTILAGADSNAETQALEQANAFGVQYGYTNGYLTSIMSAEAQPGAQCIEHWRAENYDALGRVDQETLGKLVTTTKTFKPGQNVLEKIKSVTTFGNDNRVQDLNYQYDAMNNLTSRHDVLGGSGFETFEYDELDRLRFHSKGLPSTTVLVQPETVEVRYDAIGNITYKSDVGSYSYQQNTNNQNSHRLMQISGGPDTDPSINTGLSAGKFDVNWEFDGQAVIKQLPSTNNLTFEYDQNGSVTKSNNREISWTAFDKPERMLSNDNEGVTTGSIYEYGPEQQRIYKKEAKFESSLSNVIEHGEETIYLGKYYEHITSATGAITHRYTIETGGHSIQIERDDNSNFDRPKYLLADNLGSTNVILDGLGQIVQRLAFDPWGMRLNVGDNSNVNSVTNRGYTGHEMDDETGLINMNARVYDPLIGRFLSADPVLPDAGDMQQYNRYAYVGNNPMKYVDPTGHCKKKPASRLCERNPDDNPSVNTDNTGGGVTAGGGSGGDGDGLGGTPNSDIVDEIVSTGSQTEPSSSGQRPYKPSTSAGALPNDLLNSAFNQSFLAQGLAGILEELRNYNDNITKGEDGVDEQVVIGARAIPSHLIIPQHVVCQLGCHGIDYSGRRYANDEEMFYINAMAIGVDLLLPLLPIYSAIKAPMNGVKASSASLRAARAVLAEGGEEIVAKVAKAEFGKGTNHLLGFLTPKERLAFLRNPAKGARFLGTAIHRATANRLNVLYPGRFNYHATRQFDFLDRVTGEAIELTTRRGAASHAERGANLIFYR